jgi:ribose 5-phosphate isomerase B
MRIAIGNDHAGTRLKNQLVERMRKAGHQVMDHGAATEDSVDYPDFAHPVATAVENGQADLGVLICGSANGVNMAANKHHGVRSAIAWNPEVASLARTHNDANVLSLPARFIEPEAAGPILDAFLSARFEGGRHQRRVEKIEKV